MTQSSETEHCGVEAVYRDNYELLFVIATRRFGVPDDEAQTLVHDVMLSYIGSAHEVREPRRWLLSAICNASRYFHRVRRRVEARESSLTEEGGQNEPRSAGTGDMVVERLTASAILAELKEQYQDVLRLHYIEGLTAAEIAVRLETTLRYAERLIHRSRRAAYEAYCRLESRGDVGSHPSA